MRYSDLCKAFYIKRGVTGLKLIKNQHGIGEFFALLTLDKEKYDMYIPTSNDAYAKWYSGADHPKQQIWEALQNIDEKRYATEIKKSLDTRYSEAVANNLGLLFNNGEKLDVDCFARSIASLVLSLAEGYGETDKELKDFYCCSDRESDSEFSSYIKYASDRYNLMKLIGGEEVQLSEFFVCNDIGDKRKVAVDRAKITNGIVRDASIEGIRTVYKKRGYDNRRVLLLGSGGSGKTLMLQHLFLRAIKEFEDTGILPVFLELRYFTQNDTITGFITKTLNTGGGEFTKDKVEKLLEEGKLYTLFDGLDEVDPSDVGYFQKQIGGFASQFSKTMIIIASRECDAKKGLSGFIPMYVWPFDNTQSLKLIKKILAYYDTEYAEDEVIKYIGRGFIKKDGIFASHPMMLTFVARNYPKFSEYNRSHLLFYSSAYKAMISGHDDNKKPYDRIFKSVDDAEDFTKVFSEFCAISYKRGEHEFDEESFAALFEELQSYKDFENTHKMNIKNFKQDACSTACMMYEEDEKVFYIDPGFQKYLFAHYYINASTEETKELGATLLNAKRHVFEDYEALDMIYNRASKKFEVSIMLPFLQAIFRGNNEKTAFIKFLEYGYDYILYTVIDEKTIANSVKEKNPSYHLGISNFNEPRTILLDYIFEMKKHQHTAVFVTNDEKAGNKDSEFTPVYGRYEETGGKKRLVLSSLYSDEIDDVAGGKYTYLKDSDGKPIIMGQTYAVDTQELSEQIATYDGLIELLWGDSDFKDAFNILLHYYTELNSKKRQERVY